jgi:riboflavin synthase alpha subunit
LKFYSNPTNRKVRETIRSSLVFHDVQGLSSIFIQTHLQKLYPIQYWTWVARALSQSRYLIKSPNVEWKNLILSQGEVVLDGVSFIVEIYDFRKFDGVLIQSLYGLISLDFILICGRRKNLSVLLLIMGDS